MERFILEPGPRHTDLVEASQRENRKLRDVAAAVVQKHGGGPQRHPWRRTGAACWAPTARPVQHLLHQSAGDPRLPSLDQRVQQCLLDNFALRLASAEPREVEASAVAGAPPPGRVGHRPARTSRLRRAPPGRGGPLAGAGWRAGRAGAGRSRPDEQPGRWRRACRRTASAAPPAGARRPRASTSSIGSSPCHESAIRARQSRRRGVDQGTDAANARRPELAHVAPTHRGLVAERELVQRRVPRVVRGLECGASVVGDPTVDPAQPVAVATRLVEDVRECVRGVPGCRLGRECARPPGRRPRRSGPAPAGRRPAARRTTSPSRTPDGRPRPAPRPARVPRRRRRRRSSAPPCSRRSRPAGARPGGAATGTGARQRCGSWPTPRRRSCARERWPGPPSPGPRASVSPGRSAGRGRARPARASRGRGRSRGPAPRRAAAGQRPRSAPGAAAAERRGTAPRRPAWSTTAGRRGRAADVPTPGRAGTGCWSWLSALAQDGDPLADDGGEAGRQLLGHVRAPGVHCATHRASGSRVAADGGRDIGDQYLPMGSPMPTSKV